MQRVQKCADEIFEAQSEVAQAMTAYSKGGSLAALNRANKRLADAHDDFYKTEGGLAIDNRPFNR
jgi:hypothetical protein